MEKKIREKYGVYLDGAFYFVKDINELKITNEEVREIAKRARRRMKEEKKKVRAEKKKKKKFKMMMMKIQKITGEKMKRNKPESPITKIINQTLLNLYLEKKDNKKKL